MTPEEIKRLMQEKNLTTAQLAKKMDVRHVVIWRYINGLRTPTGLYAKKLKRILTRKVPVDKDM